jgi:hypothetical protein
MKDEPPPDLKHFSQPEKGLAALGVGWVERMRYPITN